MTERLLQYIWQHQYFNSSELRSTSNERIEVIYPGQYNTNQGPDFLEAKIKIGEALWVGHIEIHVLASDWNLHQHSTDKNYANVILHVVLENDVDIDISSATLELKERIPKLLLSKYQQWLNQPASIPCEKSIHLLPEISWIAWKERLLVERLQTKTNQIFEFLEQSNNHWEETFWWLLAKNFGIKVNTVAFERMAHSIPLNILSKHKNQIHQLEAILFGQLGLLNQSFNESYPILLQKEYEFLRKKYKLTPITESVFFLRMRPSNFPTIRVAQLAMLIHQSSHLFSKIKELTEVNDVKKLLDVIANDYWHYHYTFDDIKLYKEKRVGKQMIDTIIINTIVPILFAYGIYYSNDLIKEKAISWLMKLSPEKNEIVKKYLELNIKVESAFDTQALIHLKQHFCIQKRCLDCAVGNSILKRDINLPNNIR